jgi:TP901-1 family phage major tail protein
MVAVTGRSAVLKVYNGSTYVTIGGIVVSGLTFNQSPVDVTDVDSTNQFRELLENGGTKTMSVNVSGVFKDSAAEEIVRALTISGSFIACQFIIENMGTYAGDFLLTSIAYNGGVNVATTYNATFESAGAITYTAE